MLRGMLVQIRRISIRSVFLLAMVLYGLIGLLVGVILAVVATVEVPPGTEENLLEQLGAWSVVVFPVLYGLAGGLTAAVAAALYNAGASMVGGIKVEVPDVEPAGTASTKDAGEE
jgi:ABC-type antimicrobial peptide transport system permease subunit